MNYKTTFRRVFRLANATVFLHATFDPRTSLLKSFILLLTHGADWYLCLSKISDAVFCIKLISDGQSTVIVSEKNKPKIEKWLKIKYIY